VRRSDDAGLLDLPACDAPVARGYRAEKDIAVAFHDAAIPDRHAAATFTARAITPQPQLP